jgi:hypothetical protein
MVIHVTIDTAEPLTGSASCCGQGQVPFVGWLQLLRAVAELVGTPDCTDGQGQPPGEIPMIVGGRKETDCQRSGSHAAI